VGEGTSTGAGASVVLVVVLEPGLRDDHPSSAYLGNRSVGSTRSWEKRVSEDDDEYEDDCGELLAPSDLRPVQRYSCDD
jgi:hypothetical protein